MALTSQMTPRFRNLSITSSTSKDAHAQNSVPTILFDEKDREKYRNPEKECFMCRQSNIYMNPIGLQHEQRLTRRHPPPLSRAQIEELSQRKQLSKREARLLLLCFFPEIKNVKYFQLHRYHSCCYDPKHLSLCKNHITALQLDKEKYPHPQHPHHHDQHEHNSDNEDDGARHRVSFVRIKIEPHKGIPTRFLGPAVLPESLVNMLIKQVNNFDEKKKPVEFESPTKTIPAKPYTSRRVDSFYENGNAPGLSQYLSTLTPSDSSDSDDTENLLHSRNGDIRGFRGDVMHGSRFDFAQRQRIKSIQEKSTSAQTRDDLVIEDIDESNDRYVDAQIQRRKRHKRNRRKRQPDIHQAPKLKHWELKALEQSQQESCGCRHHVRRIEADQVVYNWCRCKDHQHRNIKPKPPVEPKIKPAIVEKKTIGLDAMPDQTREVAVAYDPDDMDYNIIQESLYYRTSSGRLIKPEITDSIPVDKLARGANRRSRSFKTQGTNFRIETIAEDGESIESGKLLHRNNSLSLLDGEKSQFGRRKLILTNSKNDGSIPIYKFSKSTNNLDSDEEFKKKQSDDDDDEHEKSNDDDEDEEKIERFVEAKDSSQKKTESTSPIPFSLQKSSKPVYLNDRPTPNFERESSILKHRRWFDQPLGDENLREVRDGRYGLIAGTSTEQHQINSTIPDNDYADPYPNRNKNGCTIS